MRLVEESISLSAPEKDAGFVASRLYVGSKRSFVWLPQGLRFRPKIHIRQPTTRVHFSPPRSVPRMEMVTSVFSRLNLPVPSTAAISLFSTIVCLLITIRFLILFFSASRPRQTHLPPHRERVLILGASNEKGVGEALALAYARRGCRNLVLVARNEQGLETVRQKCINLAREEEEREVGGESAVAKDGLQASETDGVEWRIKTFKADCTDPTDVDRLRSYIQANLDGIDTLHICFGVSALLPLLGVAGVDPIRPSSKNGTAASSVYADESGLNAVFQAVNRASIVNLTGTAVVLAAFIPMLQTTSTHPSISLTSSAAALFPAPTRSIYGATKAAQLSLFRSVAIECQAVAQAQAQFQQSTGGKRRADIRFLAVCPGTISTSFRSSAVDVNHGDGLPDDSVWTNKREKMLTSESVAEKTILGVDRLQRGEIVMPKVYSLARWVDMIFPAFIAKAARKKYNY